MIDRLEQLAAMAKARVQNGYYDTVGTTKASSKSLVRAIQETRKTPIITEIKFASPSAGRIRDFRIDPLEIARSMVKGGACGISVLTTPDSFDGSLDTLATVSRDADTPTLMKDIVVSPKQLAAGSRAGASAVVLISELFSQNLSEVGLGSMIIEARRHGLEVLVEANSPSEFQLLQRFKPELYGINNRNLSTFHTDLSITEKILGENRDTDGPVVSESGIQSSHDITRLRKVGADAFLVGTSIMKSSNIEAKVRELVDS